MFSFIKSQKVEPKMSQAELAIHQTINELTLRLTEHCFNKETCTRKNKKLKKGCLQFCQRISD